MTSWSHLVLAPQVFDRDQSPAGEVHHALFLHPIHQFLRGHPRTNVYTNTNNYGEFGHRRGRGTEDSSAPTSLCWSGYDLQNEK